jgi:hypothetical protein
MKCGLLEGKALIFIGWKCGLCLLAGMVFFGGSGGKVVSPGISGLGGRPFRSPHQLNARISLQ